MATCKTVSDFLTQVRNKSVTTQLPPNDLATLQQLQILRAFTPEQVQQLTDEVAAMGSTQQAIYQEQAQRAQLSAKIAQEEKRTHSILFAFEGSAKKAAERQEISQEEGSLQNLDGDLAAKQKTFSQLLAAKAMLDGMTEYGSGSIALTGLGAMALRDLGVRLYRVGDEDFAQYWAQASKVQSTLVTFADSGAKYQAVLRSALAKVDPSYLWSVAIGLAKAGGDGQQRSNDFLMAYDGLDDLATNEENRLMAAEVLSGSDRPMAERIQAVDQLSSSVRKMGVPSESALGVASILYMGQRRDGTFALDNLPTWLGVTKSYESAALLSVVNQPGQPMLDKFNQLRQMFGSWGFSPSEDVELSSAYLTVSQLPIEGVGPKLAIISRGIATYLEYPLVASSVLAALAGLEANESLSLLEHAYEILGSRTGPMSQAQLICLSVRLLDGIQVASVNELDATARAQMAQQMRGGGYGYYGMGPRFFFVPIIVTHGAYYSTFSGIGGAHPGHVGSFGGFSG